MALRANATILTIAIARLKCIYSSLS